MHAGEEVGGVQAAVGDGVAVGVGDAGDQAPGFESAQVVGGLAGGDCPRWLSAQLGGECAQVAVGEPVGVAAERQQRLKQGMAAPLGQPQSGDTGSSGGGDRAGEGVKRVCAGDRVVAESLDVQQTSVGVGADLPQRGQIGQPFADRKIGGVVDRGFGS
jgi:hypothetical protein